jgi:hypothetical protein
MERFYLGRVILSVALILTLSSYATDTNSEPTSTTELALLVEEPTDSEIRQMIIQQSIRDYSGKCPCPYSRAPNGSRCGGRSVYSRPGGATPMCYESDISEKKVKKYRKELEKRLI